MKTIFNSFAVDSNDFGKNAIITASGLQFLDTPLGKKISNSHPTPTNIKVPIFADIIGGTDILLGAPAGFLEVEVSGIIRQIPFY